ncbi:MULTISPECIES: hypothetical protein [Bacillus]|uniref:Group-specific protein n=4 Tax=Bacillus cereus group TaxID=86661 RepID=A0A9X7AY31_BACTU|nr:MULTISPECIES: hypothetical protein [Bacillus]AEA16912.1 hypothetical protein CT43_CH3243 [Bacillus thuringiensis serovar chinensis CT-43]AFV19061.1 hypothetical protein BTB_c33770 [Bacillus thuringiensis Bt407]AGG02012.1 hypothetical protein H175_ch3299 [Bacillus thuringiensis serovar thuringiensis str. IS5056]ARP58589.1 hypothetical protein CAB88_16580 [Bacillus thuringiensis]AST01245.1 hypothetical protein BT10792_02080 [Bacillus thuringiensis]
MLKKLVAGALLTVSSLTGGMGLVSASTEKDYTISSFEYVTVDEKTVDSFNKLSAPLNEDVKITLVLPKQNQNGDWLSYGFSSKESLEAFIEKDKQRLNNSITPLGVGGSGPGSTDFYKRTNQGSEYFSLSSGYKNLSASWQNQIVSVRTASPTASYSTTLWERTSTEGYGKGVVFKHADWYGQIANLNNFPTSAVEVKK